MLAKRDAAMAGDGMYIYQNITGAHLILPRPTKAGRRSVGPREKFVGDSYYKMMKELACLQEVTAPIQEQEVNAPMQEQKLIIEQPPTVTHEGQVEYVQKQPDQKPLTEDEKKKQEKQEDILLTESPLEGIRIMR